MNLWPSHIPVLKKDLAVYTSEILGTLITKGIIKEISKDRENVYGYYHIFYHDNLVYVPKNGKMRKSGVSYKFLDIQ
jgi:hypothetical protein